MITTGPRRAPIPASRLTSGCERDGTDVLYLSRRAAHPLTLLRILRSEAYDVLYLHSLFSGAHERVPCRLSAVEARPANTNRPRSARPAVRRGPGHPQAEEAHVPRSRSRLGLHRRRDLAGVHRPRSGKRSGSISTRDPAHADTSASSHPTCRRSTCKCRRRPTNVPGSCVRSGYRASPPKKNLLGALDLLAGVGHPVTLDVYGPVDDEAYWRECRRRIATVPPDVSVTYRGPLPISRRRSHLCALRSLPVPVSRRKLRARHSRVARGRLSRSDQRRNRVSGSLRARPSGGDSAR